MTCPDQKVWLEIASGQVPPQEGERLLDHAAQCDVCGAALKHALWLISDEGSAEENAVIETLETRKPEWQARTATAMASVSDGNVRRFPQSRKWLAAAAAIVVAAGVAMVWRIATQGPPLDLLAKAYTEQRTIELRVPGAAYGPLRVERGAATRANQTVELAESRIRIGRHLASHEPIPSPPRSGHSRSGRTVASALPRTVA